MILEPAGLTVLHGADVRRGRNLARLAHNTQLSRALYQAHVVQHMIQIGELTGGHCASALSRAYIVHPGHDALVETRAAAHGVINTLPALDQPRQNLIDIVDGEGIVGAVVSNSALWTCAVTVPQLPRLVAFTTEHHVLPMTAPRRQHEHRVWLAKARQVVEVTVLSEGVVSVATARLLPGRGNNGNAVRLHHRHQVLATTGIFGFADSHNLLARDLLVIC